MTPPTVRTCPTCGYTRSYSSAAQADRHHPRHSCAGQLARADAAGRRAAGRIPRPCPHNAPHLHGTRAAYVRDTCRCAPCTAANSRDERQRARAAVYGRNPGYVDAAAARRHLQHLAAAGIGLRRISQLSGVQPGTLARLRYGDHRAGRRPSRRIRPGTEAAILAVPAVPHAAAPGTLVDAAGTRRRLQALVARGWPQAALARRVGRSRKNLARLLTATTVTRATAAEIRTLYERTWNADPPQPTPRERAASDRARAIAAARGWRTPLAWDDIDTDPDPGPPLTHQPPPPPSSCSIPVHRRRARPHRDRSTPKEPAMSTEDVDEVAIERAMYGERLSLNRAERREAVHRLTNRGYSVRQIAERLHITPRAVTRLRSTTRAAA